ncbi:MAG TPA: hypothetical protein H9768_01510 [Candidatus Mailhella merdavium]|nr:hypothetical protein [Candidatus Mailhella merdavium]
MKLTIIAKRYHSRVTGEGKRNTSGTGKARRHLACRGRQRKRNTGMQSESFVALNFQESSYSKDIGAGIAKLNTQLNTVAP